MKLGFIVLALVTVACGKYGPITGSNEKVGEIKKFGELLVGDTSVISQICTALDYKSSTISSSINSSFIFQTNQTDCNGKALINGDIETTIQNQGLGLVFKNKSDNNDYIFANVETSSSGILSEICGNRANSSNTITTNQEVMSYTTQVGTDDCPSIGTEKCIYVEKGINMGNNTYKVHTKEWIRVKTDLGSNQRNIGFFTYRKKVTQSYCAQNEVQVLQAILK